MRNEGRVDPSELSRATQNALFQLKRALANEGWIQGAQVTFDQVKCWDYPPTVDVKVIRERNDKDD